MSELRYSDRYFGANSCLAVSGSTASRGVFLTLSSQAAKFVLHFGSIMLIARLLTPEDFGLVAMVSVFLNFLSVFKDFGLSQAVVQSKEIKRGQVSSLFWINIVICLCISLSMLAIAPGVAKFYGREELVHVTILLGAGIAVQSVGLQHRALLIRTMQFGKLELIELVAMLVSFCIAIYLAILGYSYWALVWQAVLYALILSLGSVIACRWLPGKCSSFRECLHLLRFGGGVFSVNVVNYFSRNADTIIVGKFLGAVSLGIYSKAYQLLRLPMKQVTAPVSKVVLPTLSRLQDDPTQFRIRYLHFIRAITIINVPIVIYLGVFADIVVEVVLGEQWLEMVPIFRCLAPAALMAATNVAGGWVMLPLGRVSKQFYMGLTTSSIHILAMFIGLRWGVLGLAVAVSLSRVVMKLPVIYIAYQRTEITLLDFVRVQAWPTFAAVLGGGLAFCVCAQLESIPTEMNFIWSVVLFFGAYCLLIVLNPKIRGELFYLKQIVKM